jgi:GNAT superfamily N-acetyltransferase
MQIRDAHSDDADAACLVVRRSITELCQADHREDAATIALWLANKTAENMRRWICQGHVMVAIEGTAIVGVAAMTSSGEITLNYVSPDARFRGVGKALMTGLELQAAALGIDIVTLQSSVTAHRFYLSAGYTDSGPPTKGFGVTVCHPMAKHLDKRATSEDKLNAV